MTTPRYMFADVSHQVEFERLQTQEAIYDWVSRGRLTALGVGRGSVCLEAGVGAGSMLRWMADQVGPDGQVVGFDLHDRFFVAADGANITLHQGNLLDAELGEATFDIIHARLLLLHQRAEQRVELLQRFLRALKPGGWLLAFDPDLRLCFTSSNASATELQRRVLDVFLTATQSVADYTIGSRLPDLLADAGYGSIESMALLPRFTSPQRNAGFGDTHHNGTRNTYRAVRSFIADAGLLGSDELDEFFELYEAGEVDFNFPGFLTWGQRPAGTAARL